MQRPSFYSQHKNVPTKRQVFMIREEIHNKEKMKQLANTQTTDGKVLLTSSFPNGNY